MKQRALTEIEGYNRFLTESGSYSYAYFDLGIAPEEESMAILQSISLTPGNSSIALGETEQFTAMGHFSDGSTQDLTSTATWTSSATSVATIASTGIATSLTLGTTTITATSGGVTASTVMRIVNAQHNHITPPIIMNIWVGHLKFRQSFVYDTPQIAAGPDPHTGHTNYQNGDEVIVPPKPLDALQPIIEIRADIPAPRFWWGQEGVLAKDPAYPVVPVVESPTSSDSTAGLWTRGKYFAGNIQGW